MWSAGGCFDLFCWNTDLQQKQPVEFESYRCVLKVLGTFVYLTRLRFLNYWYRLWKTIKSLLYVMCQLDNDPVLATLLSGTRTWTTTPAPPAISSYTNKQARDRRRWLSAAYVHSTQTRLRTSDCGANSTTAVFSQPSYLPLVILCS